VLGYGFLTASVVPMWLGLDEGIYAKHGLDVEPVLMQTSVQLGPAMEAGDIDVALTGGSGLVDVNLAGGDQVMVLGQSSILAFQLHTRPEIQRIEDLRDKRIGITRLGSSVHLATTEVLRRAGLEAGRDAVLVQGGTNDTLLTLLINGAADAAMQAPPQTVFAEREGFRLLIDVADYQMRFGGTGLVVTRRTLESRPDLVRQVLRAHVEATGLAKRDVPLGTRTMGRHLQLEDQDLLERAYHYWLRTLDPRLWPSVEGFQSELDQRAAEIPAARTANAADYVDDRIMRELEGSGYLQQHLGAPTR
jgi:NitT/TauT family transport system substrate-binding protein